MRVLSPYYIWIAHLFRVGESEHAMCVWCVCIREREGGIERKLMQVS